ncbi:hypothetical protein [Streptomyces sp. NPDC001194]|uniref:hypothetical protein n=1 Tax=Streptomyces sp. NPDC001194 TaxID=3364547 RepID=UPI0036C31AE7
MSDVLPADVSSASVAALAPAPSIARLDVPAADVALQMLLARPPAGHTPELQPAIWYERVFDALACAHPEKCTKPKTLGGQP